MYKQANGKNERSKKNEKKYIKEQRKQQQQKKNKEREEKNVVSGISFLYPCCSAVVRQRVSVYLSFSQCVLICSSLLFRRFLSIALWIPTAVAIFFSLVIAIVAVALEHFVTRCSSTQKNSLKSLCPFLFDDCFFAPLSILHFTVWAISSSESFILFCTYVFLLDNNEKICTEKKIGSMNNDIGKLCLFCVSSVQR